MMFGSSLKGKLSVYLFIGLLAAPYPSNAQYSTPQPFDPASAFCERQTFVLENHSEVVPWLDYFSGLRSGRSQAPTSGCPSSAIHSVINIVSSGSTEMGESLRDAFLGFYVSRAMETELGDRRNDIDGSFRYRNDVVLAGFVWLLCPGRGGERVSCVRKLVGKFPKEFLQTSPVFCDFSEFNNEKVEWPPNRQNSPLLCAQNSFAEPNLWLQSAEMTLVR